MHSTTVQQAGQAGQVQQERIDTAHANAFMIAYLIAVCGLLAILVSGLLLQAVRKWARWAWDAFNDAFDAVVLFINW